jgi:hypothetical protein
VALAVVGALAPLVQGRSLRKDGKKSPAPGTAATVKETVSYLASRRNPSFLDLDD